jgi:hypothetical protein
MKGCRGREEWLQTAAKIERVKKVVKKFTSTFGVRRSPSEKFFSAPRWLISKYATVAPNKILMPHVGQNPGSATGLQFRAA